MAPDAIHSQVLQWDLGWDASHLSTVKMPAHNTGYSPVIPELPAADPPSMVLPTPLMSPTFPMFRNLQRYLWGAFQRVLRRLWVAKEVLSRRRLFTFLCSGYQAQAAMKGDAEKSIMGRGGAEEKVEETRSDQTAACMLKTQMEEEMEVLKRRTMEMEEEEEEWESEAENVEEFTDDDDDDDGDDEEHQEEEEESDSDWMEWRSEDEEEDEDEDALHQQTIHTSFCVEISFSLNSKQANEDEEEGESDEEEDSEWSEDEDDDDDSEASAESVELWESFLQSDDPYNPLSFSSSTTSKTSSNTHTSPARESTENTHTSAVKGDDWREEEEEVKREDRQHSTHDIQQKKKVRFSDEVVVRPLVDWAQASREARDGSCWLEMARDRDRFRRRVEETGKVIGLCLSPEHRRLVWEKLQKQSAL